MADADVRDEIPPVMSSIPSPRGMKEFEALPSYSVEPADVDYAALLQKFKDRALFVQGVLKQVLASTKPHHWLARKSKSGETTFSLMGPGAERIRTLAPIGFQNLAREKMMWQKEAGPGYTYIFQGEVFLGSNRHPLPVHGSCSSDDPFYAVEHVELPWNEENPELRLALESGEGKLSNDKKTIYIKRQIPSTEVTEEYVIQAARTALIVNGVTRVLGIRSMSGDELKEAGIDVSKIGGFEYGSGKEASGRLSPADEQKRTEIKKMLVEMNGGDEPKALAELTQPDRLQRLQGMRVWDRITVKQTRQSASPHQGRLRRIPGEGQPQEADKSTQAELPAKGRPGRGKASGFGSKSGRTK